MIEWDFLLSLRSLYQSLIISEMKNPELPEVAEVTHERLGSQNYGLTGQRGIIGTEAAGPFVFLSSPLLFSFLGFSLLFA